MMAKKKTKKKNKYTIVTMAVEDLTPAPYNPRTLSNDGKRALKKSLQDYGLLENLIWNKRTGNVVGGHQRLQVLKESGVKEVPVRVVDLSEEDEKALNVTLNNPHVGGEWEPGKLRDLKEEIKLGRPDTFDGLMMFKLQAHEVVKRNADPSSKPQEMEVLQSPENKHPEMELMPYEHYDYIAFFFEDSRDFQVALQKCGVKMVQYTTVGRARIGLGRCLKGKKLLDLLP